MDSALTVLYIACGGSKAVGEAHLRQTTCIKLQEWAGRRLVSLHKERTAGTSLDWRREFSAWVGACRAGPVFSKIQDPLDYCTDLEETHEGYT